MRLNLGEIASLLGCRRDRVLWSPGPKPEVKHSACSTESEQPHSSFRMVAKKRLAANVAQAIGHNIWIDEPWAENLPTGAEVDSRRLQPGMLFFCLPGERADGHEFAKAAAQAGASAVIAIHDPFSGVRKAEAQVLPPVFLVEDVRIALWRIAMCHRDTSLARVVGITGTAGKTSVKETLAQTLAIRGRTERNPLNFNNQIGLPISMLNSSADASFWVMEIGISEAHDMDELGRILRPDIALILNVGDAHMIGLGAQGVAFNKAKLLDYIQIGGLAVVSADYPELTAQVAERGAWFESRGIDCIFFSAQSVNVRYRAEYLGASQGTAGRFRVCIGDDEYMVEAPFRGSFGCENVAAICTTAAKFGLTMTEIVSGLARARLPGQRFHCRKIDNFILIDDSYNANLLSAKRMIEAAACIAGEAGLPLVLVMGEMLELGEKSADSHKELGEAMARAEPVAVMWKGGQVGSIRQGLVSVGYGGQFYPVGGGQDFTLLFEELDLKEGVFLFKGSRGNHLERLVEVFQGRVDPAGACHVV